MELKDRAETTEQSVSYSVIGKAFHDCTLSAVSFEEPNAKKGLQQHETKSASLLSSTASSVAFAAHQPGHHVSSLPLTPAEASVQGHTSIHSQDAAGKERKLIYADVYGAEYLLRLIGRQNKTGTFYALSLVLLCNN